MALAARLREKGFAGEILEKEPLARHCSLRVGGEADLMAVPENMEDLRLVTAALGEGGERWLVLGGGTNVLFSNGGFAGCVIRMGKGFSQVRTEGDTGIFAGASALLSSLVAFSGERGLEGLECLSGIPGTVGGGVRMNAGTASGEISDTLQSADLLRDSGESRFARGEMGFSYRSSVLREGDIILGARFQLGASTSGIVRERIREQLNRRKKSQPLGVPSAGCWFRNPEGDSAGRLIDEAGMKGVRCGGAQVSRVHANFLVNAGEATARDFLALADRVREAVLEKFGIILEEEVQVVHG